MYGPDDLDFSVYGTDFVVSRAIALSRWASLSPYGSVSWYLARAHEKTNAVSLSDENVFGAQATAGTESVCSSCVWAPSTTPHTCTASRSR